MMGKKVKGYKEKIFSPYTLYLIPVLGKLCHQDIPLRKFLNYKIFKYN